MNTKILIEKFGTQWIITKNGKIASLPMGRRAALDILKWYGIEVAA